MYTCRHDMKWVDLCRYDVYSRRKVLVSELSMISCQNSFEAHPFNLIQHMYSRRIMK